MSAYASKAQRELVELAKASGFYEVRKSKSSHIIMRHPGGAQITIAGSPSDRKAVHAVRNQIRQALRAAS